MEDLGLPTNPELLSTASTAKTEKKRKDKTEAQKVF